MKDPSAMATIGPPLRVPSPPRLWGFSRPLSAPVFGWLSTRNQHKRKWVSCAMCDLISNFTHSLCPFFFHHHFLHVFFSSSTSERAEPYSGSLARCIILSNGNHTRTQTAGWESEVWKCWNENARLCSLSVFLLSADPQKKIYFDHTCKIINRI